MRKAMVEKGHPHLSQRRQCELLGINRNRLKPRARVGIRPQEQSLARRIDEMYLDSPEMGARRISYCLGREGLHVGRRVVERIMKHMGIEAVYCKPNTSKPAPGHKIYPYLLRHLAIKQTDQVWCADITYIPMARGTCYLVAVMDWRSRAVLAWRLSNSMDVRFCLEAYHEAVRKAGRAPDIFNTDQGSQFTCREWTGALEAHGVRISMDGKGRWRDNVMIERLWRSVKYEGVYLWAYEDMHQMEEALGNWFERYNRWKPHKSLEMLTPWQVYRSQEPVPWSKQAA